MPLSRPAGRVNERTISIDVYGDPYTIWLLLWVAKLEVSHVWQGNSRGAIVVVAVIPVN